MNSTLAESFSFTVIPTVLPAVLAPLTEADTALATATWSFLRSFGLMVRTRR